MLSNTYSNIKINLKNKNLELGSLNYILYFVLYREREREREMIFIQLR